MATLPKKKTRKPAPTDPPETEDREGHGLHGRVSAASLDRMAAAAKEKAKEHEAIAAKHSSESVWQVNHAAAAMMLYGLSDIFAAEAEHTRKLYVRNGAPADVKG